MISFRERSKYFVLLTTWMFIFSGCATTKQKPPHYIENNFDIGSSVKIITLLPVVDNRKDKTVAEDYVKEKLIKNIETELMFKGYKVEVVAEFKQGIKQISGEINEMKVHKLAKEGPIDSEYLFLFSLNDSKHANAVIAKSFTVEATGCLIDKHNRRLIWKAKCSESENALGLVATMITPVLELSMKKCFEKMFSVFPHKSE